MKLHLLLAFLSLTLADVVTVNWQGMCNGNQGFGFQFESFNGGAPFQPDAKMGLTVPCDEYFEVSWSWIDPVTGHVISFPNANTNLYSAGVSYNQNGIVAVVLKPENPTFGNGYLTVANAVDVVTNQPFAFTCTNGIANVRFKTNYYLAATNNVSPPSSPNNYARTLETVIDTSNWNPTNVTEPFPANQQFFAIGQSTCNGATGTPITYTFPAFASTTTTPVPPTSAQPTSAQQTTAQQTTAQQTSAQGTTKAGTTTQQGTNVQQTSAYLGGTTNIRNGASQVGISLISIAILCLTLFG